MTSTLVLGAGQAGGRLTGRGARAGWVGRDAGRTRLSTLPMIRMATHR